MRGVVMDINAEVKRLRQAATEEAKKPKPRTVSAPTEAEIQDRRKRREQQQINELGRKFAQWAQASQIPTTLVQPEYGIFRSLLQKLTRSGRGWEIHKHSTLRLDPHSYSGMTGAVYKTVITTNGEVIKLRYISRVTAQNTSVADLEHMIAVFIAKSSSRVRWPD